MVARHCVLGRSVYHVTGIKGYSIFLWLFYFFGSTEDFGTIAYAHMPLIYDHADVSSEATL